MPFLFASARALCLILLGIASVTQASADDQEDGFYFCFFRANGQSGIYLAASEDGLHFTPLNNDEPVMKPAPWAGQNLTRDPSMVYHAGKFHAVWTTGWRGNCFGYAESSDLVHWSEPVRVQPFPASQPQPANTWAPEICWDPVRQNFMIFWSSDGKIYVTRTDDGTSFTAAKLFIDPPFPCIDGMLALDQRADTNRWVIIFKNEAPEKQGGKNLHLATAPEDFSQPWSFEAKPIIGPGTGVRPQSMCEGPSLLKTRTGWNLYWDSPLIKTYAMASSVDLIHWTDCTTELRLPTHPRHGTIFRAPRSAVGWEKKPAAKDGP